MCPAASTPRRAPGSDLDEVFMGSMVGSSSELPRLEAEDDHAVVLLAVVADVGPTTRRACGDGPSPVHDEGTS